MIRKWDPDGCLNFTLPTVYITELDRVLLRYANLIYIFFVYVMFIVNFNMIYGYKLYLCVFLTGLNMLFFKFIFFKE